jgi:hypothetical protein
MANQFDRFITDLQKGMDKLSNASGLSGLFKNLGNDLNNFTANTLPLELKESIKAFESQFHFTTSTDLLLNKVINSSAKVEDLNTATNLVQFYFQGTQSLNQILPSLLEILESLNSSQFGNTDLGTVRNHVQQILSQRKELQKNLNKALQEFGSELDEIDLDNLLQRSGVILNELSSFIPSGNMLFNQLSSLIDDFVDHLIKAQKLFKSFGRKSEDLIGNEPNQIKQLILNWGGAINRIDELEKTDAIKDNFNRDASKSRSAIAQSIKIHELLEQNYDLITVLVRSGDLESVGIL